MYVYKSYKSDRIKYHVYHSVELLMEMIFIGFITVQAVCVAPEEALLRRPFPPLYFLDQCFAMKFS